MIFHYLQYKDLRFNEKFCFYHKDGSYDFGVKVDDNKYYLWDDPDVIIQLTQDQKESWVVESM